MEPKCFPQVFLGLLQGTRQSAIGQQPSFDILKLEYDSEAFWSFFYIWFGFLCAQVSFENCEICNFGPKASESCQNFIISNLGYCFPFPKELTPRGLCEVNSAQCPRFQYESLLTLRSRTYLGSRWMGVRRNEAKSSPSHSEFEEQVQKKNSKSVSDSLSDHQHHFVIPVAHSSLKPDIQ